MTIGSRKHLVTLERPGTGRDPIGQPVATWTDAGQAWADIRYLRGLESIKAGAQGSTAQVSIRLTSFRTDLTTGMRVRHNDVTYAVLAVLPDMQRRRFVDLACEVNR